MYRLRYSLQIGGRPVRPARERIGLLDDIETWAVYVLLELTIILHECKYTHAKGSTTIQCVVWPLFDVLEPTTLCMEFTPIQARASQLGFLVGSLMVL